MSRLPSAHHPRAIRSSALRLRHLVAGAAAALACSAAPLQAAAVSVIDFDSVAAATLAAATQTNGAYTLPAGAYVEDGYRLNPDTGARYAVHLGLVGPASPFWTGSFTLFNGYGPSAEYSNAFVLSRVDGQAFDLLSLDAAAFNNQQRSSLLVYGVRAAGGPVLSFAPLLDNSYSTLQHLTLPDSFRQLSYAQIWSYGNHIDNLNLAIPTAVPEVGTLAMALAGLGLLAARRFRRR